MFGRVNPLIKRLVLKKLILLKEYAKFSRLKNYEKMALVNSKLELIDELLCGKG